MSRKKAKMLFWAALVVLAYIPYLMQTAGHAVLLRGSRVGTPPGRPISLSAEDGGRVEMTRAENRRCGKRAEEDVAARRLSRNDPRGESPVRDGGGGVPRGGPARM